MRRIVLLVSCMLATAGAGVSAAAGIDWATVDQAMGRKGTEQPGGIHKYSFPRSDLQVTVDGIAIKPALALGGWVAFQPTADGAMFMGDLVLTDTEINPVMKRLIDENIEISAIHNHLLRTSLPVFYMHVGGHGDPVKIAGALTAALSQASKTPMTAPAAAPPATLEFDSPAVEKIIGFPGKVNGGVLQFSVPRSEDIKEGSMSVPPAMGTAMAINFEPTGSSKAAITGDLVLLGDEVNPVLKTLRRNGIEVTALHSHMIDDSPHLFFMHFWGVDDAQKLARGMRAALDLTNIKHGT